MTSGQMLEVEGAPSAGGRGTERVSYNSFIAIKDFVNAEYLNQLTYDQKQSHLIELISQVTDEVKDWNEATHNFNMLWEEENHSVRTHIEADIKDNLVPVHSIHGGNLGKNCFKWSAILTLTSRDFIQGGEIMFKHWNQPVRIDNYGKHIGDPKTSMPQWINEQGTLIIYPSIAESGYKMIVSGEVKKLYVNYMGEPWK